MSNRLHGLYRAVVRNNDDPEQRCRLQVDAPVLGAASPAWAEACVSSPQPCNPAIGESVWILFEAGDVNFPVWIGRIPAQAA